VLKALPRAAETVALAAAPAVARTVVVNASLLEFASHRGATRPKAICYLTSEIGADYALPAFERMDSTKCSRHFL
jgi:hypothetical protein